MTRTRPGSRRTLDQPRPPDGPRLRRRGGDASKWPARAATSDPHRSDRRAHRAGARAAHEAGDPDAVTAHGGPARLVAFFATLDVDLDRLKRAAKAHGATVNDAFVTAVATGLACYHEQHGAPVQELRATVAVRHTPTR